jgi:hypothetical protein
MVENMALTWSCVSAINGELEAVKDRRSAEAVTELAVKLGLHLARENERLETRNANLEKRNANLEMRNANLEKRVSQLECGMLNSIPAAEDVPFMADDDVELAVPRISSTEVHANLASKAIEAARLDEQRHRTSAIFILLRVGSPALVVAEPQVCAPNKRASHRLSPTQFTTSEVGEILSSVWGAALLALGYYGPNKMSFDGIRDLDDTSFAQALTYSLADAGVEAVLFAALAFYLYSSLDVRAIPTFATYIKAAKLTVPFAGVCGVVPLVSLSFFLEHNGVDPSFQFAWVRRGGENATGVEF